MAAVTVSTGLPAEAAAAGTPARRAWIRRDLLSFLVLAAGVRLLAALLISQPGYTDAYYYYAIALNLASGRGFVEDFVWNHLLPVATLPQPSNAYWPPLTSIIIAPWLALFGDSFRSAQIPILIAGVAYAAVGFGLGAVCGGSRRAAWWAGLLTLFPGVAFPLLATTDSFALYGLIGTLSLATFGPALTRDRRWYLATGALAGLAALTRADGLLFAVLLVGAWPAARLARDRGIVRPGWFPLFGLGVCLLVLLPWLLRNLAVFGTPLPGAGLTTAFLRDYNDIFGYPPDATLTSYLAWGPGPILWSKLQATGINLLLLASLLHLFLVPFAVWGLWRMRRDPRWWPPLAYGLLLIAALSWVFTLPGQRGAFFHSAVALVPFLALAALAGLDAAIATAGRRFPRWSIVRARRNYARIALGFAAFSAVALAVRDSQTWDRDQAAHQWAAEALRQAGAGEARVMVADSPGYWYAARTPAIAAVNEDLDTTVAAARDLNVRFVLLEPAHPEPWHAWHLGEEAHPALRLVQRGPEIAIYEVLPEG